MMMLWKLLTLHEVVVERLDDPEGSVLHEDWKIVVGSTDPEVVHNVSLSFAKREADHLKILNEHSTLIMAFAIFENALSSISCQFLEFSSSKLKAKDFFGKGIEREKLILSKLAGVTSSFSTKNWQTMTEVQTLRNQLAHSGSWGPAKSDASDGPVFNDASASRLIKLRSGIIAEALEAARIVLLDVINEVGVTYAHP
jgi:hypothetical protein